MKLGSLIFPASTPGAESRWHFGVTSARQRTRKHGTGQKGLRLMRMALAVGGTIAVILLTAPSSALAIGKCKAKVNRAGTILINATGVDGGLTWGESAVLATRTFFNAAGCITDGKAKNCAFGAEGTARAVTPPEQCAVHLKDSSTTCVARIKGCTPGVRGGYVKDTQDAVLARCPGGISASCEVQVPDGRSVNIGALGDLYPAPAVIYYETPDCTGQPYLYSTTPLYGAPRDTALLYPAVATPAATAFLSAYQSNIGCFASPGSDNLVPAQTLDISSFQPPYHFDTLP